MFAEGWVVYPRPRGSPGAHLALGAARFMPGGICGPTHSGIHHPALSKHLNFKKWLALQILKGQQTYMGVNLLAPLSNTRSSGHKKYKM